MAEWTHIKRFNAVGPDYPEATKEYVLREEAEAKLQAGREDFLIQRVERLERQVKALAELVYGGKRIIEEVRCE